jgi:hypothetical protein
MPNDVPVLSSQLQDLSDLLKQEMGTLKEEIRGLHHDFESMDRRVANLTGRIQNLEINPSPEDEDNKNKDDDNDDGFPELEEDVVYGSDGLPDNIATNANRLRRRRLQRNRTGMGGNRTNDDPFAKLKFTIPSFPGKYDAEEYLDWEMLVEQKFAAHLVPDRYKVRQATSEFKDFALIWWASLSQKPDTWENLKLSMRDRFVPITYKRDLRKKLQRLEQGDMSVQEYFAELQKGMMRCGVVEDLEDKLCRFYGGLRREI